MKTLNKTATKVLDALTADLAIYTDRTIDNTEGTFMAVNVERLTQTTFSVSHNFVQNGDLMADPDVVFHRDALGRWFPMQITQHSIGVFRNVAVLQADGSFICSPTGQADLASFCNTWLRNIKRQQGSLAPATPAPEPEEAPVGAPRPKGPMSQLELF